MKNFYFRYISLIIIICLILLFSCFTTTTISTDLKQKHSSVVIYVKNKHTDRPIDNATICILNTKEYYQTDKHGYSETIKLPLFDEFFDGDYYYFNLLIYKNGYNDFIYFNLKTKPNQKRADIVIELIEIINSEDNKPVIFFESPLDITIKNIIKENKR